MENEFDDFLSSIEENREYTVCYPTELFESAYVGELYGLYIADTRFYNIIGTSPDENNSQVSIVGYVTDRKPEDMTGLLGLWEDGDLSFYHNGKKCRLDKYTLIKDILSRNTGILESTVMLKKKAMIVGCGSGGSFIALELAKSGVGRFVLIDNDVFGYHNIGRHQCGIYDVGKKKTHALKERILAINPRAEIVTFEEYVEKIFIGSLEEVIDEDTVILSCGDNRASAHYVNKLSAKYHVPMIAAGAGSRASTGEIFYYLPDSDMPCYSCVFGEDLTRDYTNEVQRVWYANQVEEAKNDFQPGIAADIDFISIIVCKLAIDVFLRNDEGHKGNLLPQMKQLTYICNYMGDRNANPLLAIFKKPLQMIGVDTRRREGCYLCKVIYNE